MGSLKQLAKFLLFDLERRERNYILCVIISISAVAIIPSVAPVILAHITDALSSKKSSGDVSVDGVIVLLIVLYLTCILTGRVVSVVSSYLLSMFRLGAIKTLCEIFFKYLVRQEECFFVENNSGLLVQRLNQSNNDLYIITRVVAVGIISPLIQLSATFMVLFYNGYMLISSLFILYAVLFMGVNSFATRILVQRRSSLMDAGRRTYSVLDDSINNFHLARHFRASNYLLTRYQTTLEFDRAAQKSYWRTSLLFSGVNASIFLIFISAAITWAAVNTLSGAISIGGFVMITSYTLMLTAPMESLGNAFTESNQSLATFIKFIKDIRRDLSICSSSTCLDEEKCSRIALHTDRLSFRYPGSSSYAIHNVNVKINSGSKVAITGSSGSGKTTFIKIISKTYRPTEGKIVWFGIENLGAEELWGKVIGLVSQETYIFQDTIRFNLAIAKPNASDSQLIDALRLACLDEYLLSLPHGLDTILGNKGATLSGGQRQRIAIARLFLKNPDVLIIDEGTSSLDAISEDVIIGNILRVFSNSTVIFISHRANILKKADEIIVFSDGLAVEAGSWDDLKNTNYLKKIIDINDLGNKMA